MLSTQVAAVYAELQSSRRPMGRVKMLESLFAKINDSLEHLYCCMCICRLNILRGNTRQERNLKTISMFV